MSPRPRPSLLQAIARGVRGRCPACGDGRLFWRYLKVNPTCESCGHELAKHPADDGPAYLTILIVGHLVVAPLLFFPIIWEASPALVLPATLIPLAAATLALLPRVKGGFIGVLYTVDVKDSDADLHTADIAKSR
jgi:uncharacterized protein (DUF983 family)